MTDPKFGKKRQCSECEAKFYDLNKSSGLKCPRCGKDFEVFYNFNSNESYNLKKEKNNTKPKDYISEDISIEENSDSELAEDSNINDEVISLEEIEENN